MRDGTRTFPAVQVRPRNYALLCAAIVLTLWLLPGTARAQFQDPTPDELKMTSDPKAPDAAAVYLFRERDVDDVQSFRTIYERIKVLTEKGKDLATIRIPYEKGMVKLADIKGRTIHPDGTIIPLAAKPDDLVEVKTKGYQENLTVFTLPSVEVGSILEYRYEIRYEGYYFPPPNWEIQQPYFVHKEHFSYRPTSSGSYASRRLVAVSVPRDAKFPITQNHGVVTLDLTDIPPLPDEDWMPPINTIREHVELYYSNATSSQEFWKTTGEYWARGFESFTHPTGNVKDAAAVMVSASDTDDVKARKIYAAIMQLDNSDFSREKSEAERKKEKLKSIRNAGDVLKNRSGSANELALLYVALARAAGLKATPMWLASRSESTFDEGYLSVDQLTDFIVVLDLGGKSIYLDPGQRYCPFGKLVWTHSLAGGLQLNDNGAVLGTTPAEIYKDNATIHFGDLTIDQQGSVTGTVRATITGDEAIYWRQKALENDPEEVKKQFIESIQDDLPSGVEAKFDHFLAMDDYETSLMAVLQISGELGEPSGKYFILPGLFFNTRAKHPFTAQTKRTTPIDLHFPVQETDEVHYHFPPGYTVEGSPKTGDLNWQGSAILRINSGAEENGLKVVRMFARGFTLLGPDSYSALHDFYIKVASADQQQIILARTTAPKGN